MRRQLGLLAIVCLLVLTGCAQAAPPSARAGGVLRIGFAGPQTGEQAEFGKFTVQAVLLAVDEWNARGGINGTPIQLMVEDDQGDPKQTVVVAQKLIDQGIVAMIGPGNSGTFIPASLVFNAHKIPEIGTAVSNPIITERGLKYVVRINPRDDALMPYAADYLFNKRGIKSAAILHDKTAYGEGSATQFRDEFQRLGGNVLLFEGTNYGDTDFTGVLTKIKGLKPQTLVCGCNHNHSGYVVLQAKQLGIDTLYMIGDSGIGFDEVAGDAKTGVLTVQSPGPLELADSATFVENYEQKWNSPPDFYSHMYYAGAQLLFSALRDSGTDADKVMKYLHNLKGFASAFGPIEFDAKGDNIKAEINMYEIPPEGYPYKAIDHKV